MIKQLLPMISAKKNKAIVATQPISLPKTKKQGLMQRCWVILSFSAFDEEDADDEDAYDEDADEEDADEEDVDKYGMIVVMVKCFYWVILLERARSWQR